MARPSNTHERRAQIVAGLLQVMAERGYARATIVDIARAAKLRSGLVHYHFNNKQEILLALVEHLAVQWRQRHESCLARCDGTPWGRLDACIDAHLALGPDASPQAVACWVSIGAEAVTQPEVRAVYQSAMQAKAALLRELLRDLLTDEGRPVRKLKELTAGLLAAIEGAYQLAAAAPSVTPRGFAARTIKRMARGLIDQA